MTTPTTADTNGSGVGSTESIALFQDSDFVIVHVGSSNERESWNVHMKLLAHASPFFASAFNGYFSEAVTKSIELPEDNPDAFRLFVQWLYSGKSVTRETYEKQENGKYKRKDIVAFACSVWHLGDKLLCPIFKDFAIIRLIAHFSMRYIMEKDAEQIYEISPPESSIRKLAVDQVLWDIKSVSEHRMKAMTWNASDWAASFDQVDDYAKDILERLIARGAVIDNPFINGSRYLEVLDWETHKMKDPETPPPSPKNAEMQA
ncbi:MAG: hypothetical protein Q9222_001744 [Ikaeria aurantiellina]